MTDYISGVSANYFDNELGYVYGKITPSTTIFTIRGSSNGLPGLAKLQVSLGNPLKNNPNWVFLSFPV